MVPLPFRERSTDVFYVRTGDRRSDFSRVAGTAAARLLLVPILGHLALNFLRPVVNR